MEGQGLCPWTPLRAEALKTHLLRDPRVETLGGVQGQSPWPFCHAPIHRFVAPVILGGSEGRAYVKGLSPFITRSASSARVARSSP